MDRKHLDDFLEIAEEQDLKTGDLVSEYTALAIQYSKNQFTPTNKDYDKAYETIINKYRGQNE